MAGIAGIIHLDGVPVNSTCLENMAEAMTYRSQDGANIWHEGAAGLVHCHFWTTPEEIGERQPICDSTRRYWLTADARIDNRSDLIPLLQQKGYLQGKTPTDAEVILAAFQQWGQDCPRHLLGDFAFAVWDTAERRLFAARDVIGIRQIFYLSTDRTLYFGSTIGAVLAALPFQPGLNTKLIEAYLRRKFQLWLCQTVYNDLLRLPPAHILLADNGQCTAKLYYQLGSQQGETYSSDAEWIESFRAIFTEAISCRLRSATPVAIQVSGGIDSSSVACAAYDLLPANTLPDIHLYSAVFEETPGADEKAYFEAVANKCKGWPAVPIVADSYWALRDFGDDGNFPLDEPEFYSLRSLTLAMLAEPSRNGCRVVLSGDMGDQVLGHASYRTPAVLRTIPLRQLPAEARYFRQMSQMSWPALIFRAYVRPFIGRGWRQKLRLWNPARSGPPPPWIKRIHEDAESAVCQLDKAFLTPPNGLSVAAREVYRMVRHAYDIARFSAHDVISAYVGVEWRHPFLDQRLVEFSLRLPHHLRSWQGRDRVIVREALRDILPEQIQTRQEKSHFISLVARGLFDKEWYRVENLLYNPRGAALGFLDPQPLYSVLKAYKTGSSFPLNYWQGHGGYGLLQLPLCLEAWLRHIQA